MPWRIVYERRIEAKGEREGSIGYKCRKEVVYLVRARKKGIRSQLGRPVNVTKRNTIAVRTWGN